jgi:hypothetical protein
MVTCATVANAAISHLVCEIDIESSERLLPDSFDFVFQYEKRSSIMRSSLKSRPGHLVAALIQASGAEEDS